MKARLIELNNKSRKGLYVYVKETGKAARYYKYKEGDTIDDIISYYTKDIAKKQPKSIRTWKKTQAEKYVQKVKRRPAIKDTLKKGITHIYVKNIHTSTTGRVQKAARKLLKPLVRDEQLLDILSEEENLKKLKTRFSTVTRIETEDGKILAKTENYGKTPEETARELRQIIKNGMKINLKNFSEQIKKYLDNLGYKNTTFYTNGTIERTTTQIILRKG